jgi:NDP-sugar pyrophosphorylase family protein
MEYKACILAAGKGTRMAGFCELFNKVLIPIQGKPTICHIIEKFPEEIEIVIAVGYLKEQLINFLKTAYPNRKLVFVDVGKYEGPGTGPGYSLLQCREHLQCPFLFVAGDTLVKEDITPPHMDWIGVAPVNDTERLCSVKLDRTDKVIQIDDKVKTDNKHAYIGLTGIYNYDLFWNALEGNKQEIWGEIQVSNGIQALKENGLYSKTFTWFDTGTPSSYKYASENYPNGNSYQGD